MARTEVPVTTYSGNSAGVTKPAEVAANLTDGNVLSNLHDAMWLEVTNTHASIAADITFVTPGTVGGRGITDDVIELPALAKRSFGPFDRSAYGNSLQIDCEAASTITMRGYQCVPGY